MINKSLTKKEAANYIVAGIFNHFFVANAASEEYVFLEKTPEHLLFGDRILETFPEAQIVEVIRDGRDVCVSMELLALKKEWPPGQRQDQIETWKMYIEHGLSLKENPAYAERVIAVRYEDLKADPVREIEKLFRFCGLEASPELIADVIEKTSFRTQSKGFNVGAGHFFRKGSVGDWRTHFSAEDYTLFQSMVGDLFEKVGYEYD